MPGEFLSTLLPRPCPLCRRRPLSRRRSFCRHCLSRFAYLPSSPSTFPSFSAAACDPILDVRSVGRYVGSLREAILRVKYGRDQALARSLGRLLRDHYPRLFPSESFDRILPVPLHPTRLRARRFNQSVLLARPLARALEVPLELQGLARVRPTRPQTGLAERERRRQLRGAFRCLDRGRFLGRSFLVVDDVTTTGATLEEISKTILEAGAARVSCMTVARTPDAREARERGTGTGSRLDCRGLH